MSRALNEAFARKMREFVAERDAALLSLDKEKSIAYGDKWGVNWNLMPENDYWFWVRVHMARTGAQSLPLEARIESKKWLTARGHHSMDNGELP